MEELVAKTPTPEKSIVKKEKPKEEPKKQTPPNIKRVDKEIKHDLYGNPYVEMSQIRGPRGKAKEVTVKVHPSLVDSEKRAWDMQDVTGKFKFYDRPGSSIEFWWKPTYLGAREKLYKFTDGEVVTIPRALADHLRKGGKRPVHQYMTDEKGKRSAKIGTWYDRFDFFEISDNRTYDTTKKLVTVEYTD